MRVRWTRRALRDLDLEVVHIAEESEAVARAVAGRIRSATQRLTQHPESGRLGRVAGTRELVVPGTPYILPYRSAGRQVEILRVLHGARKWPRRFDE